MFSGAYSARYQKVEDHHLEQLKQNSLANRGDVLAKSKLLSHETNRRRRALAIKRKVEAQREEKRRQEILFKRRQRQREATEKFQRQTVRKTPRAGEISPPKSPTCRKKTSPNRGVTSSLIPGLEEALKAVRGNPPGKQPGSGGLITCHMDNDTLKSVTQPDPTLDGLHKAFYNKYSSHSTPLAVKDRVQEQVKEQAARADLHNRSLRNLTNSRSLFEQQLEQQQQLLHEKQQKSLREFNAAIRREIEDDMHVQNVDEETEAMGKDQPGIRQSESLSSLDSLEAHCSPEKENSFTDTGPVTSDPVTPALDKYSTNQTAQADTQDQRSKSINCLVDKNNPKVSDGKLSVRNHTSTLGIPFVDSSRSDITVDTVSTIDIREGCQQRQIAKQFFLPRYDMFTDNCHPNHTGSGMVNEWVSEQNSILNKSSSTPLSHISSVNKVTQNGLKHDNSALSDVGTFYVKSWAPSSTTVLTTTGPHAAASGGKDALSSLNNMTPGSNTQTVLQQQHNVKPQLQNQPIISQSAKISSNSNSPVVTITKPVKKLPSSTISSVQSSPSTKTNLAVTDGTVHTFDRSLPSSGCSVPPSPSRLPVPVKPVANHEPSVISNGGLGFSNGCLIINGEGSEQGSDNTSDMSECSRHYKQTKSTTFEVKGILKTAPSDKQNGRFKRSNSFGGKATGFDVQDSIEIMRRHKKSEDKLKPKKKSVRFADFEDVQGEIIQKQQEETTPVQPSLPQKLVTHKPPRPTSAKLNSNSPKDSPSPARRAVSAGTVRPSPQDTKTRQVVRPQAAAHIITHQSSFNSPVTTANGYQISLVSPPNNRALHNSTRSQIASTKTTVPLFERTSPPGAKYPQPVYDDMGFRLDRTPTDEEINWLWDKVRTCLHRDSQASSRGSETTDNSARQTVLMSSKVFDGTMLGPHANVSRVAATNLRRYNSAESVNSYSKRSALLQQRQQQPPHSITSHRQPTKHGPVSGPQHSPSGPYQSPKLSGHDPEHAALNFNQNQDVSESMAGFLAAETLANQSVSDSVMQTAVDVAQQQQQLINSNRPHNKVPTALSIEEQRLMESIDKLNEKLKITENSPQKLVKTTVHVSPQQQHVHTPGFRGHQPLAGANKQFSQPAVKIHYRTGSGTVSRTQTQYRHY